MTHPFVIVAPRGGGVRRGRLLLPHGEIETPLFLPVATRGAIRVAPCTTLGALGVTMVLANTFHLLLRPGLETIRRFGGLHAFLGWGRPILTDSGGFQVFSLAAQRTITDDGIRFRSPVDGAEVMLTPKLALDAQRVFGSDIAMVLDDVRGLPASHADLLDAVRRTTRWARVSKDEFFESRDATVFPRPLLFGIVQGGMDAELRRAAAVDILGIGFDGYAIGGLSVGEAQADMLETLDVTVPLLPDDRPRYLMGVGEPEDIVEAVRRGVDLFDCVLPTRNARHALVYAELNERYLGEVLAAPLDIPVEPARLYRRLTMTNEQYALDTAPLNASVPLLAGVTRGYLRHLFQVDEPLAPVLATTQNLWFYLRLMAAIRESVPIV